MRAQASLEWLLLIAVFLLFALFFIVLELKQLDMQQFNQSLSILQQLMNQSLNQTLNSLASYNP